MLDIRNYFAPSIGLPGLQVHIDAGVLQVGGVGMVVPATDFTLPKNSTSYLYLNTQTAGFQSNTSGYPATNCYPIATVVTSNTGVNSIADNRPDVTAGGGGSGVSSLNTLTGALTLAAGSNVTITPSGETLTIASSGGTYDFFGNTSNPLTALSEGTTIVDESGNFIDFTSAGITLEDYAGDSLSLNQGLSSGATFAAVNAGELSMTLGGVALTSASGVPITATAGPGCSLQLDSTVTDGFYLRDDSGTNSIGGGYSTGIELLAQGGLAVLQLSDGSGDSLFSLTDARGAAIGTDGNANLQVSISGTGAAGGSVTIAASEYSGTPSRLHLLPLYLYGHITGVGEDFAGQQTITAGNTSGSVTFHDSFVGTAQPVVVVTPTSNIALVPWVTYSGSAGDWTGFTVNIPSTLVSNATFNYIVIGQQ